VIPTAFDYAAPTSLDEALRILAERPGEAKLLAGGHSLIPVMKLRLASPSMLVDLARVPGLSGIRETGDGLSIGATTTHAAIANSPAVQRLAPALAQAARQIGDRQVRARGTIGGSAAHADPASDYPGVLLALGATIVLRSTTGERTVPAEQFFTGLMETAARPDEAIVEIRIPAAPRSVYAKFPNPASHYPIVGVAAAVKNGGVRIGVSGAAPVPFRATAAEERLAGGLDPDAISNAANAAHDGRELLGDLHASSEYRAHLLAVMTRRALAQLAQT
jgi:carbon-monoxide dehydrogenase medium subunit